MRPNDVREPVDIRDALRTVLEEETRPLIARLVDRADACAELLAIAESMARTNELERIYPDELQRYASGEEERARIAALVDRATTVPDFPAETEGGIT